MLNQKNKKQLMFWGVLCCLTIFLNVNQAGTVSDTRDYSIMDLGEISSAKSRIKIKHEWINNRKRTLKYKKIARSCSCVTVVYRGDELIESDEKVTMYAEYDIGDREGYNMLKYAMLFDNDQRPAYFVIKFFKPSVLQAKPRRVDFGTVYEPKKISRTFQIRWLSRPTEIGMKVDPNISSKNNMVLCQLVGQKEWMDNKNSAEISRVQDYTFNVQIAPRNTRGKIDDIIKIPIELNGTRDVIEVPVRGKIRGEEYLVPEKLIVVVKGDSSRNGQRIGNVTRLEVRGDKTRVDNVKVFCEDQRVNAEYTADDTNKHNTFTVGTIRMKMDKEVTDRVLETVLAVSYTKNSKAETIYAPVKIINLRK